MLVVKRSNFVHDEEFLSIFQILIFFISPYKLNQRANLELVHI